MRDMPFTGPGDTGKTGGETPPVGSGDDTGQLNHPVCTGNG